MGYIYLLKENGDDCMYKIGVTTAKSIETRIKKLQTGNGNKILLINSYQTDIPFKIEKMLHAYFQLERQEGEWFLLTPDQVNEFIPKCEEYQKIMDSLKGNPFVFKQSSESFEDLID